MELFPWSLSYSRGIFDGPGVREITEARGRIVGCHFAGKSYWSMMVFMGFHGKLIRLTYYDYYHYYYIIYTSTVY